MSEQPGANNPRWLEEFEKLANEQLESGSSYEQIHLIVEQWFGRLVDGDPPESRDSVAQAMACLSNEILYAAPAELRDDLIQFITEDDLALWIEHVLLVGRAFEIAVNNGDLDDL
jgi:hypothetical protein